MNYAIIQNNQEIAWFPCPVLAERWARFYKIKNYEVRRVEPIRQSTQQGVYLGPIPGWE